VLASKKPTVRWLCCSIHKCRTSAGWVATDSNRVFLREIGSYGFNRLNPILKPKAICSEANVQNPSKERQPFIPLVDVFHCAFPSATFSFSAPCRGLTLGNRLVHYVHWRQPGRRWHGVHVVALVHHHEASDCESINLRLRCRSPRINWPH
jgi:hypothetical protein